MTIGFINRCVCGHSDSDHEGDDYDGRCLLNEGHCTAFRRVMTDPTLTDEELAAMEERSNWEHPNSRDLRRLIAALRASRAVADDLAVALHHCSAFLPLFIEESPRLQRALAVYDQSEAALAAYCDLTDTRRPDLNNRTVTTKEVHD